MLGFSWGEIFLLLLVGMLVVGPKNLPSMMRTAGQWIARLRRMSSDLRSQSGIDELIRIEGLEREVAELRSLARLNLVETIMSPAIQAANQATSPRPAPVVTPPPAPTAPTPALPGGAAEAVATIPREREYPTIGCDAYDALPDDAIEPKTDEAKTDEAKTDEAKTDEAKTDEAKTDDAKTESAQAADDAKVPDDAKVADEAKASEAKADASASAGVETKDDALPADRAADEARAPEMST